MDDEFALEVLRLAEGYSLDNYEDDLKRQAQELAITPLADDTSRASTNSKPTSTLTTSSRCRRSNSNGSQASRSTGLTADYLRTSKEHTQNPRADANHGRRSSGTSLSIKDYDSILTNAQADHRRLSLNFSPPITPSPSTFSLPNPSSLSRDASPTPRRSLIRGFSRLKLRRNVSNGSLNDECPHCPHRGFRPRRILHTLPCGHRYCTLALRNIVKTATDSDGNVPPTCCNTPIPGALVEMVMSEEEQDALMSRMIAWDDTASAVASANTISTNLHGGYPTRRSTVQSDYLEDALSVLEVQEAQRNLDRAMNFADFKNLRQNQEQQRDRLVAWDDKNRRILSEECIARKQQRSSHFNAQTEELSDKQVVMISHVEDKHVLDEADLRKTHDAERRNTATALRHMEAYCRGETITGEPHGRTVTEQDLRELSRAQYARDHMETRQAGAINVLRGEQGRRMNRRLQQHEQESLQLEARQHRELESIQRHHDEALRAWDQLISNFKAKLQDWWYVETEIWRKRLEKETDDCFEGALPPILWSDRNVTGRNESSNETFSNETSVKDERGEGTVTGSPILPTKIESGISSAFAVRSSLIGQAL